MSLLRISCNDISIFDLFAGYFLRRTPCKVADLSAFTKVDVPNEKLQF